MRTSVLALLLAAPFAAADEQAAERTFSLTQAATGQNVQEIAAAMRTVAGIRQVFPDGERKSITVRGTAGEVRLAGWIAAALERPGAVPWEYAAPGAADETYRVFQLTHAETPRDVQEMATLVRSIGDAQYVSIYAPQKALLLRGGAWQLALTGWLAGELNRPADTPPPAGPREYRLQGGSGIVPAEDVFVRVFYTRARTPEELLNIFAGLRSAVKMLPRAFINTARRAIIVRASAGKIGEVEQALAHLHQAAAGGPGPVNRSPK